MVENFMQLEVHWSPFNNYGCIYFFIWNDGKNLPYFQGKTKLYSDFKYLKSSFSDA